MSKYNIEGTIVDTDLATASWHESTRWDGSNHISLATGSQWEHQRLYRSRRGRYWLECTSQWQGSKDYAEFVDPVDAARWILTNEQELPEDLAPFRTEICE